MAGRIPAPKDGSWSIAVDTGGTFTDVAAQDRRTGRIVGTKVPSRPDDPALAVLEGIRRVAVLAGIEDWAMIELFAHGTTVATNALIEGAGGRVGLLVTEGMRAVYEVGGASRPTGADLIDPSYRKPPPLVTQRMTREIPERVTFDGKELRALDEPSVRAAARDLVRLGAQSIAICFLFSYLNPGHEREAGRIVLEECPDVHLSLSSEVLPTIREYTRFATTILDAYVGPTVGGYLNRLEPLLAEEGLRTSRQYLMQSSGGLMRLELATRYPHQTLLSGPAAGVVYGSSLGVRLGESHVVTFDMGGTSTDIAVIQEGRFSETRQGALLGHDIGSPMIEILTLGAGGGTIASVSDDGRLSVGPKSAGADPGPAAYDRGGRNPTVTDADLVLGYLPPGGLAGGLLPLDVERSRSAIDDGVASPLGLSTVEAAIGISRIVNATMAMGLRLAINERGLDPRKFLLVAFGGAGPVHAAQVARDAGIPRVLVPAHPGIGCAFGLLESDVRHVYLKGLAAPLRDVWGPALESEYSKLEVRAAVDAGVEEIGDDQVVLERQLELRYALQGYDLSVRVDAISGDDALSRAEKDFHEMHQIVYGTSAPEEDVEIVNVRLVAIRQPAPPIDLSNAPPGKATTLHERHREVSVRTGWFAGGARPVDLAVHWRDSLISGQEIFGPAIIEQDDTTTVVYPDQRATVLSNGDLLVELDIDP